MNYLTEIENLKFYMKAHKITNNQATMSKMSKAGGVLALRHIEEVQETKSYSWQRHQDVHRKTDILFFRQH